MHNVTAGSRSTTVVYSERLTPSLWAFISAAVCAPMAALVFAPLDGTIALGVGLAVGIALIAALVALSPRVVVADGWLRVGRARIAVRHLGAAEALVAEDARQARGPGLARDDWHLLRGGIDGVLRVAVVDGDDPIARWVFSSRTPERIVAAIGRAQAAA